MAGVRLCVVGAVVAALLTSACTVRPELDSATGCGPVTYADVRGHRPSYGSPQLARFANDHAMCAGRWVPGADEWLVPQGMTIADGTAYVASFDGTKLAGHRLCTMQSMDLKSGELIRSRYPVVGQVGPRQPTECRHGGGVVADEHGVWLAETLRLWLLDPDTLEPVRGWALTDPVRGSFAVFGKDGRLGLGRFRAENPARLWWFDVDAMLASSAYVLDEGDAVDAVRIPPDVQGALWAELGGVGPGLWLARSNTSCGVLVGPDGTSRAFVPGAEGMALTGRDQLWVVSESGSRLYQEKGRPMTPMLARLDTSDITQWTAPACTL
ncbi:hypothetical protein J2X46_004473 [Nocardioides sp. BE266]|uniref:hypothetical protein n=1 Tax=Nocardioides sp. BE266 TaxID=2817725 RepID=UPI0028640668|nr:hypothetical protein [Nocardioides sp. BE266]MDR7255466.1 hypothetical protein [Nocardioides sp. BE266]